MKKLLLLLMSAALVFGGCSKGGDEGGQSGPEARFTVKFETNGGSAIASQKYTKGAYVLRPLTPKKEGSFFAGWHSDPAMEIASMYDFNKQQTEDLTLYAKWTTTISKETLGFIVADAQEIITTNYTPESGNYLVDKRNYARNVYYLSEATTEQMTTAYNELMDAMSKLVALPHLVPTEIKIMSNLSVGETLFVRPGYSVAIYALATTDIIKYATNSCVVFTHTGLESWAKDGIRIGKIDLSFTAKDDLVSGASTTVLIRSAENPAIMKVITLVVKRDDDIAKDFIDMVAAIPEPEAVSYEHFGAIKAAENFYSKALTSGIREREDVEVAYSKLQAQITAAQNLPERVKFSFSGNDCTWVYEYYNSTLLPYHMAYEQAGEFPLGTYTNKEWIRLAENIYLKAKYTLKAGGEYSTEVMLASNAQETEWRPQEPGTYTFEGDRTKGGYFYFLNANN